MKKEYDFSKGKQGPVIKLSGKTRITIHLDNEILDEFRDRSEKAGYGYQTMINEVLREHLGKVSKPVDARTLRRILREELQKTG
ncbi:MAG: hypothetical protein ACI9CB_002454 [Rhodothermales bacterium]|jgi:uncharacterized protein (DUF4415 family)